MRSAFSVTTSILLLLASELALATDHVPSSQSLKGTVPHCSFDADCSHGDVCVFGVGCVSKDKLSSQPGGLGDVCASSANCHGSKCWNAARDDEYNGVCGIYGAECTDKSQCAFGLDCIVSYGRGLCFGSPNGVPDLNWDGAHRAPAAGGGYDAQTTNYGYGEPAGGHDTATGYPAPSSTYAATPPAPTSHAAQDLKGHIPPCSTDSDCTYGHVCIGSGALGCVPHDLLASSPGHVGDICAASSHCQNGVTCWNAGIDSPVNGVCGIYGATCNTDADCAYGNRCDHTGSVPRCFGPEVGVPSRDTPAYAPYPYTPPAHPPYPYSTPASTQTGAYRGAAGGLDDLNVHAAAGDADSSSIPWGQLKTYGIVGLVLILLNALLMLGLIGALVVLWRGKKGRASNVLLPRSAPRGQYMRAEKDDIENPDDDALPRPLAKDYD